MLIKSQTAKMSNENSSKGNTFFQYWYFRLILGIVSILSAFSLLIIPEKAVIFLPAIFALILILTGLLEIISSIQLKKSLKRWKCLSAAGLLDLLVAAVLFSYAGISGADLTLLGGFVFSYSSVKIITWSGELKKYGAKNGGYFLFGATLGVTLAFLFLWNRSFAWLTFLFFTGFALQANGVSEIYFSFVLRNLKKIYSGEQNE
ncbi:MAG TPA: DUF308 domain-containing protein [Ignavibacteriaceae bacterium]|nr:DUF308 domain-containing protein [Ignavibacteriaceae bacterium]